MMNDVDEQSVRCRCEWSHPVDGEIDPKWPAVLDPACPVHAEEPDGPEEPAVTEWLDSIAESPPTDSEDR